jgi:hypothetical protein
MEQRHPHALLAVQLGESDGLVDPHRPTHLVLGGGDAENADVMAVDGDIQLLRTMLAKSAGPPSCLVMKGGTPA